MWGGESQQLHQLLLRAKILSAAVRRAPHPLSILIRSRGKTDEID